MARQGIFTGSSPNDGTGDSLAAGAVKVNQNFSEIYSTFGDGNNLISYVNTAGIATVAGNLTGNPSISVTKVVGAATSSIIPFLWNNYVDLPAYGDVHGAVAHVHETGKLYYAHGRWIELVNMEADRTVGTGTENYNVGVITASFLYGDGSNLTNLPGGVGGGSTTLNDLTDVTLTGVSSGQLLQYDGTTSRWINASVSGLGTETDPVFTASVAFGIGAGDTANWTTAYGWGDHSLAGYASTSYVDSAVVGFITAGSLTGYATEGYVNTSITGLASEGYVDTAVAGVNTFTGAATTITTVQIGNWDTAYGWGNHATAGYITTAFAINDLSDVNAGAPSTGQVLKWSGTEWQAASDLTAAGAGIGLSDLSVTITPAGINSLTYNNTTGVFLFTPTNLSGYATTSSIVGFITSGALTGYATQGYVDSAVAGVQTFTGAATTITTTQIGNWDTAYSWGNHASQGYLTNVNISAGANIDVVETSEGNFIITSTSVAGAGGTWAVNAAGIHTTKNVGIGTALSSSALTVEGDGRFSGVVTATRFQSTSAGTPTIDSPNNLNINAVTVAISTDLTVGASIVGAGQTINSTGIQVTGVVTATSFVGSGSNITGISTLNIVNYGVGLGGAGVGTDTLQSVTDRGNTTTAEITAANFRTNDTVGDGTDVGFAIKYYVTANGFSAYRFAGPGLLNTTDNPTFYLQRGFTYIFENSTGGSHPFRIQFTGTTTGVGTYVSGSQTGTQVFTIPFDAPSSYQYQCTLHAGMLGTFNVA